MLKYTVGYKDSGDDFLPINYNSFKLEYVSPLVGSDEYSVTFSCDCNIPFEDGASINVSCEYKVYDDVTETYSPFVENYDAKVVRVSHINNDFSIAIKKYKALVEFEGVEVVQGDNETYWDFIFTRVHTFNNSDTDISLTLFYGNVLTARFENLEYINSYRLRWVYDSNYPEIDKIQSILLSNRIRFSIYRDQFVFQGDQESSIYLGDVSLPQLSIVKPKMTIKIPISVKEDVNLMKEVKLNETIASEGLQNAINPIIEMEKRCYTPVIYSANGYKDVTKINFNLHFREHSGDNWTVKPNDSWNNIKTYSETGDTFFPYRYNDNQSDLLSCLDFTNKDVKYQKNVLKKSFLRLSYYDSMNEGNQNLLGYSVVYLDVARLYSKYMYTHDMSIYINSDFFNNETQLYEVLKGGKVDTEVRRNELAKYIDNISDEIIEKYRLSSQISVENKWLSGRTSEGFYVYLWVDNNNGIVPSDLYMKVEFNHAGYGRTIPLMLPYNEPATVNDNGSLKTMGEISDDWNNGGYNVSVYKKYSYVKLKYVYDKDNGRYVYYLDPKRYGILTSNILNINLYEARISF